MQVLFPTGRMVGGSLSKLYPRTDSFGKPKLLADGTPSMQCNIGFAIRKGTESHWSQTAWGAEVFKVGASAYPNEHKLASFAWKIIDGDSAVPNKKGHAPNANENYRGHWVMWFSQGWFPEVCNADGSAKLTSDSVKPGYFIKVLSNVTSNAPSPSPGVYLNPLAIALVAEGDEIASEVDTTAFAQQANSPLPPGARPLAPAVAGFTPAVPVPVPMAPPPPNLAFLQVPPPPAARNMTALAKGASYEALLESGWTEALLLQHGLMLP